MRFPALWLLVLAAVAAACSAPRDTSEKPELNRTLAAAVIADTAPNVMDALRTTLADLDYELTAVTDTSLAARSIDPQYPSTVQVDVRPVQTGTTLAEVVSRYPRSTPKLRNHSYYVLLTARNSLSEHAVDTRFVPIAVYPAEKKACAFPDRFGAAELETGELELPRLRGGEPSLEARVSYPAAARSMGITGTVFVKFVVDAAGHVSCAEVHGGLPGGLNSEALAAAISARYEPATYRGEPVPFTLNLPLSFKLYTSSD